MKSALKKELASEHVFETQDIQLAASIIALGGNLATIDRHDPNRCTFAFEDSLDVRRAVDAYWRKQLSIEPQTLFGALKAIKSRLYGERL